MKLHHILYTLLLISLFPITSNGQPARKEKLRVISYNIWNGFEHDASRRANFIDWIKGQQPDILAITELVGFTEKNLGQLASEYGGCPKSRIAPFAIVYFGKKYYLTVAKTKHYSNG